MERIINLFGPGFVGGRYIEKTANFCQRALGENEKPNVLINDRENYEIQEGVTDVLYFISTIDNYNVHTDPLIDIDTNLTTLMYVLSSIRGKGDVTFNFISSWFVYGDASLPAREDAHCNPKGFYSITKRCAEQLVISYCETFGIKYRILRLANVLGPQDTKVSKKKNAFQYMVNEIVNNRDIDLYDGGRVFRDYIYVDDAVDAINLVLEKGEVNQIYNIGNGEKIFMLMAMQKAKELAKSTSNFNTIEAAEFHKKVQTPNMVLDTSKLKALGYQPKYSIDRILEILIPTK